MKKIKGFICFDMLKEGYNFIFFKLFFSSRKQNSKYVQNILLSPPSPTLPKLGTPNGVLKGNKGHAMTRGVNPIIITISLLKQQP
jgi:hypothetical protein